MLKPTNRYNLPEPITAAIDHYATKYDRGGADISATQLGEPPRVIALKNRHYDEIQEDYADRLYALEGHVIHEILEHAAAGLGEKALVEQRFFAMIGSWMLSGQVDIYYDDGHLQDYKSVSVAQRKRGVKKEWVWQLNVLAHLLRANNLPVTRIEAVRRYRDWSLSAKQRETDYPACAVETLLLPLWTPEEAAAWIADRVEIHRLASMVNDDAELPECTMEERWNPGSLWAVMKPGAGRALRVLPTEAEAAAFIGTNPGSNLVMLERPGINRRCQLYCNVWQWCAIGRREHQDNRITDEIEVVK